MKRTNINRLNAAITTTNFCDASAAETAAITAFAVLVLLIKSKILIVQSYNQLGDTPTSGVTLNTKALRKALMEAVYKLGNAIFSYAAGLPTPDEDMMAQSKLVKGTLENLSKEECATECDRIQKLAATLGVLIAPYGASATDITDTGSLVTLYLTSFDDPRAAVVSRSNAKKQANLVLNNIMDNLLTKQLDPMANTLRYTNPSWWNQYDLSREVIDLGISHTKLNVFVKDAGGDAIQGATASLIQNNAALYFDITGSDGTIVFPLVKPGTYDLRVDKPNFATKFLTGIEFKAGKKVKRTVTLVSGVPAPPPNIAVVREGDLAMDASTNVSLIGIKTTPTTNVTTEVTNSTFRVYAAVNQGDPLAVGAPYKDFVPGPATTELADALSAYLGLGPAKPFLMIQNTGAVTGHWKMTFDNLEP